MYTEGKGNTPTSSLPPEDTGKCAKPARRRRRKKTKTFKIQWALHPTGKGKCTKGEKIRTATGGSRRLGRAEIGNLCLTTHLKMPWISQALLANLPENVCRYEALAALLIFHNCQELLPELLAMLLPSASLYWQTEAKVALAFSRIHAASSASPLHILQSEERSFRNASVQLYTYPPFGAAKAHAAICNLKQAVIHDLNTSGVYGSPYRSGLKRATICDLLTAVEVARKTVTEVLMMQCLALCENPQASTLIEMVEHAYGGYMTTVIREQVLNAYHLMNPGPIGFASNNQAAYFRRTRRIYTLGTCYSTDDSSQLPELGIMFRARPNVVVAEQSLVLQRVRRLRKNTETVRRLLENTR